MLPDFLYCENKSALPGAGLILYTKPPFWMGQVIKFDSHAAMDNFVKKHQPMAWSHPHDYNILISHIGMLGDYQPTGTEQEQADSIARIYRLMSDFYLANNVSGNETRFKRYYEN